MRNVNISFSCYLTIFVDSTAQTFLTSLLKIKGSIVVFMSGTNIQTPFGLQKTNRSSVADLMSKNNFTTEAPLIFAMYMDRVLHRGPVLIEATVSDQQQLTTRQIEVPLRDIFGTEPENVRFEFEQTYQQYDRFAYHGQRHDRHANRSDVVVINSATNQPVSAFEVKLCVIPNSGTANRPHDEQSLEIVVRPPTIEQLAFSIADTYGNEGKQQLRQIIVEKLGGDVQGYRWSDKHFMMEHMHDIKSAVEAISLAKITEQKPFCLTGIWRTKGQSELLESYCFDTFAWTNLAFLQLLSDSPSDNTISRPDRSLVWLIKALLDYTIQNQVNFNQAHSEITFDSQTDKAGAFSGAKTYKFMNGERFNHPLISSTAINQLIPQQCMDELKPERRLDAALKNARYSAR